MFFFHQRGVGGGGGKIWMENSITFNVFFIDTFPKTLTVTLTVTFKILGSDIFEAVLLVSAGSVFLKNCQILVCIRSVFGQYFGPYLVCISALVVVIHNWQPVHLD